MYRSTSTDAEGPRQSNKEERSDGYLCCVDPWSDGVRRGKGAWTSPFLRGRIPGRGRRAAPDAGAMEVEAAGKLVIPSFVESTPTWTRLRPPWREDTPIWRRPMGSLPAIWHAFPRGLVEDIKARSRRVLDWELASGTGTVRTHVLVCPEWGHRPPFRPWRSWKEEDTRAELDLLGIVQYRESMTPSSGRPPGRGQVDFLAGYPLFTP